MISIREVAKQTNLSVRTLRYYDQINLLQPAGKTSGGHRLYNESQLAKLQEIQFLKQLGFELKEIKEILENPNWDWETGLLSQLDFVVKEKERLTEMEQILTGLLNSLVVNGEINFTQIQKMIKLYQKNTNQKEIFRKNFFPGDDYKLLDLLPNMNSNDPDTLEWIALIGKLKQNMSRDPSSKEVQRIIRRIYEKTIETFGDNYEFFERVWEIRSSAEKSAQAGFFPIEDELIDYFSKAYDIFEKEN